jgi:hypothetical protein
VAVIVERRSGRDRRQSDRGSPTGVERRRCAEKRKPELVELAISDSDWLHYFGKPAAELLARPVVRDVSDEELNILSRVRD